MEREHKLSFYFIIWTVLNSIRDQYIPPEGPHSWHWKMFATLFVRHLESLVCCETQHSNQNTPSRWLKREFRDITDVLIYRDIPDCSAGETVEEIFETSADKGEAKDYEKAVKALNDYFIPKVNSTYQHYLSRSMEQQDGETVAQFVTRLRLVVKDVSICQRALNRHKKGETL